MIRIDTHSYNILGQTYGLSTQKCGKSGPVAWQRPQPVGSIAVCRALSSAIGAMGDFTSQFQAMVARWRQVSPGLAVI